MSGGGVTPGVSQRTRTKYFAPDRYAASLRSIARALRRGGFFIAYEWIHREPTDLKITEIFEWYPEGLTFWFRSQAGATSKLKGAGFDNINIQPFEMPIDLSKPAPTASRNATSSPTRSRPMPAG